MNKEKWIFKKDNTINVTGKNFSIKEEKEIIVVTFLRNYRTNQFNSIGIKKACSYSKRGLMEDLPRELEKEIKKLSQPVQIINKKKTGLFLINDFGKVKPVGWIKTFIGLLSFTTFFTILLTCLLYYLYADIKTEK